MLLERLLHNAEAYLTWIDNYGESRRRRISGISDAFSGRLRNQCEQPDGTLGGLAGAGSAIRLAKVDEIIDDEHPPPDAPRIGGYRSGALP
jgi:hypothetical protein